MPDESNNPLMELLAHLRGGDSSDDEDAAEEVLSIDIEGLRLHEAMEQFLTRHDFRVGMIVRQKPLALGYRKAGKHDLGIVVELIDPPIVLDDVEHSAGSPYFRKPLDLIIGHRSGGNFAVFHVDSRHYEPVPEAELRLQVRSPKAKQ